MANELTKTNAIESALIDGDLSKLTEEQRLAYYKNLCESLGLNPLSKPFAYLRLNGKLVLYALKDATDQLRASRGVSIVKLERERIDDIYAVTAYATDKAGRSDSSIGAVTIGSLRGDNLANALMKAETKAKRRVTLSICGLGMLDETEIETIRDAQPVTEVVTIESAPAVPQITPPKSVQNIPDEAAQAFAPAPRLPAEDEARMAAATKRTPAPTNGNEHTRETFFGLAQAHGLNKEAAKIATAHSKDQDWKAATSELEEYLSPV